MPMYGSGYVFSKKFFTGWITVGIIWIFCSFIGVGLFPVFEGRKTLAHTFKSIFQDIVGGRRVAASRAELIHADSHTSGDVTPLEKTSEKGGIH